MKSILLTLTIAVLAWSSLAFAAETQTANAGKYTVELATQPATPVVGENQVIITVKDGETPVTGAGVSLHVDMVGMSMPMDVTTTPGSQDGQYVATVNLGMAGQWKITADVQGMAGMAMDGDGKATFTVTAGQAGSAGAPVPPATPAGFPLPLIIGGVVVVGVVVVAVVLRGRAKSTPHIQ